MRFISWVPADEERDAALVPVRRPQRHPALPDRRPVERPRALRRLAAMARQEGVEEVVIGLTYSISAGAHARVLRRARGRARRLRRHGPPLPQGSRRPADAGRRARAGAALPPRPRASRPIELHSHCTIGLAPLVYMEGLRAGLPGAAHGRRAARARHVEPGRRDDAARPRGRGLLAPARPRRARRGLGALPRARARARACRSASRRSSTPPTTTTSSPAAW